MQATPRTLFHGSHVAILAALLLSGGLVSRGSGEQPVPDADLAIPDETRFEAFTEFSMKDLTNVVLYNRYPAAWQVTDMMPRWRAMTNDPVRPKTAPPVTDEEVRTRSAAILKDGQSIKIDVDPRRGTTSSGKAITVAAFEVSEADLAKSSFLLCFNRQGFDALYVNGTKAFDAERGFASFTGDITPYLKAGANSVALVNADLALAWENELVVAPKSYVRQMLLTTDLFRSMLTIDCFLVNNGPAGKRTLTAKIISYGDPTSKVQYEATIERELLQGTNAFVWAIRMLNPVCWSPDNPHMYELHIGDGAGQALGKDRFGFREFRVKNGQFLLNGNPIKLYGSSSFGKLSGLKDIPLREGEYQDTRDKRFYYAYLRMWKQAHCNTLHSYGRENERRGPYEACDELGLIAYSMFPAWADSNDYADLEASLGRMKNNCINLLRYRYNHPSLLMITFGSELYAAKTENLNYLHHQLGSVDKHRRLLTSSGRIGNALNKGEEDVVDFADDHSYWGTMNDSWMLNGSHFRREKARVAQRYGDNAKPLVTSETFEPYLIYTYAGLLREANRVMTADKVNRADYVKLMQDNKETIGIMNLVFSRGTGLRKLVTDEVYGNSVIAELFHRIVEQIRQDNSLDGFLPFHITAFTPYAPTAPGLEKVSGDPRFAGMKIDRIAIHTNQDAFIKTPQFHAMKRVFNPQLVSARWFDRNLIAGSGAITTTLYALNETTNAHAYTGYALFRAPDGKELHRETFDFGQVASMGRQTAEFKYAIPNTLATGEYHLELVMAENGRRVSDNRYTVFVFAPDAVMFKAVTDKKVAFYASAATNAILSEAMLKSMALPFTKIKNFADLEKFQILIVAEDSIDDAVAGKGAAISAWVEKGGRLLALAQSKPGYLPWLPDMEIIKAAPVPAIDMVEMKHPIYQGLRQEYFDTWSGDGYLFKYALDPLNKAVIAAAGTAYTLNLQAYKRSIVSDVALGKGAMILNQLELAGRYGRDAVATIVANNLVRHILTDDRTYSEEIERTGRVIAYLDREACSFVDLKPFATAALQDNPVASDGIGGWDDYSDGNDCEVPVGEQRLNGVPYYIIPPEENANRSAIIMDYPRLTWSVKSVKGIKAERKFHELHILHTGLGNVMDYTLTFHYADGSTAVQEIKKGIHIGSWIKPPKGGLPQADFGWTGSTPMQPQVVLWHTKWTNPNPLKLVKSIDIESPAGSGACIVAMTMYEVIGEEGWEDKRIQEQKAKSSRM